jgi:hypothetical protein
VLPCEVFMLFTDALPNSAVAFSQLICGC